ncbi:MAG: formylglycine-generating enzyme family protein [Odoribacter sp.]|nr:formylglycine-generating enzyme family protein [Odoribacter sp.]
MRFIVVICMFLQSFSAFGQVTGANRNQVKKVAILEVVDKKGTISDGIKLMVRTYLAATITNTPGYEGYDRTNVASIMSEQNFQRTGHVSDAGIKRLGEMTGADYILVAEVAELDGNNVVLTAQILDIETAKAVNYAKPVPSRTRPEDLEKGCRELAMSLFNRAGGGMSSAPAGGMAVSGEDFMETAFGINMKMVYVSGGSFTMGATSEQGSDAYDNEKPAHQVTLSGYYIGAFEVTQGQWEKVMGTSVAQQRDKADSSWPLRGVGVNYPMYYVSWDEAQTFCRELSRRTGKKYVLPTEAQWEYAARGGNRNDGAKYSGSDAVDVVAWYAGNSGSSTHPVGTKRPNALGLYDMSGNVYEWCADWYGSYSDAPQTNPTGPSSGSRRVSRGGSWNFSARSCRVSNRDDDTPSCRGNYLGFRVVCLP